MSNLLFISSSFASLQLCKNRKNGAVDVSGNTPSKITEETFSRVCITQFTNSMCLFFSPPLGNPTKQSLYGFLPTAVLQSILVC